MAFKKVLLYWKQSPFQRIAFFNERDGSYSLTLNDFWQFNSGVEHIYHECLFTMPSLFPKKLNNVLVLGGGDGIGARELLKFPSVKRIDLIDLDPDIISFAKEHVIMTSINKRSFHDAKVKITTTDAKKWLDKSITRKYDLVIVDFPDPTCDDLWTLYEEKLYKKMAKRMHKDSVIAIQSSTYNTKTFDLIFSRLKKVFPYIIGYHTGASSVFCGFFLCSFKPIEQNRDIPKDSKWITPSLINQLLCLPVIKGRGREKRDRGLSGFGASFGKSAVAPPPAAPADVEIVESDSVVTTIRDLPLQVAVPPEDFFVTEDALDMPASNSGVMRNPLILGGIAAVVIVPLVIKMVR